MRRVRLALLLTCAGLLLCVWAWRYQASLPPATIEQFMTRQNIPGAVVAVHRADGATKILVLGKSRDAQTRHLSESTVFPVASLSKPITAAAVRAMVERGQLTLESPIADALPTLPWPKHLHASDITIHHLLTHTGGMPGAIDDPLFANGSPAGCDTAIQQVLNSKQLVSPGRLMLYSNVGYCLLGRIIAYKAGQSYEDAVLDLLQPEGRIYLGPPAQPIRHEGAYLAADVWRNLEAAGGWFSDAGTLAGIYSRDARDLTISAVEPLEPGGEFYYGLGWRVWPVEGGSYFLSHFGVLPGMFSVVLARPDGSAAVVLFNGRPDDPEGASRMILGFLRDFLQ